MWLTVLCYLDDIVLAGETARASLSTAQILLHPLQRFRSLVHPTKPVGTTTAIQSFQALGTLLDLATQTLSVPPARMQGTTSAARLLAEGPANVAVGAVARLEGLIAATWVSRGPATRIRNKELDAIFDKRPLARSTNKREIRKSWAALVPEGPAAREEAAWWVRWLANLSGSPSALVPWTTQRTPTF